MFKRLSIVIAVLALVSAAIHTDSWWTLLLPFALLLYPIAVGVYVVAWLSPILVLFILWLLWHWVRYGKLPASVTSRYKRLREHRIFKHRIFRHPVFRYRIRIERSGS